MIFRKIGVFGWSEKFYFPEIKIRWPKKKAFDHGNQLPLLFSLQRISGKRERKRERERERERARARGEDQSELQSAPISSLSSSPRAREEKTSPTTAIDASRDRAVDRDLAFARSRRIEITIDGAISRSWIAIVDDFFLGCGLCFLDLCFTSSFPNTRKYFPENLLKCSQTHENIFLFQKLAFPENMYFPENVLQQPNTA